MASTLRGFGRDERGATAIEYGLIAALIAVAVIAAMGISGGGLQNLFNAVSTRSAAVWDNASTI